MSPGLLDGTSYFKSMDGHRTLAPWFCASECSRMVSHSTSVTSTFAVRDTSTRHNQATKKGYHNQTSSARNAWDFSLIRLNLHVARMAAGLEPDGPSLHSQISQFRCMFAGEVR